MFITLYRKEGIGRMTNKLIKMFNKERDEAVISYDVETFKKFYYKWKALGYYDLNLPEDKVIEVTMRKMVCHITSFTDEQRAEAREWLLSRGYTDEI